MFMHGVCKAPFLMITSSIYYSCELKRYSKQIEFSISISESPSLKLEKKSLCELEEKRKKIEPQGNQNLHLKDEIQRKLLYEY